MGVLMLIAITRQNMQKCKVCGSLLPFTSKEYLDILGNVLIRVLAEVKTRIAIPLELAAG